MSCPPEGTRRNANHPVPKSVINKIKKRNPPLVHSWMKKQEKRKLMSCDAAFHPKTSPAAAESGRRRSRETWISSGAAHTLRPLTLQVAGIHMMCMSALVSNILQGFSNSFWPYIFSQLHILLCPHDQPSLGPWRSFCEYMQCYCYLYHPLIMY